MSVVLTVVRNVRLDSEQYVTSSVDYDGESGEKVSAIIPALSIDHAVVFGGFDPASLKAIWFTADVACTIGFVSGTGVVDVTLAAGGVLLWTDTDGVACPFDEVITSLTVTCTLLCTITGRLVQA